MPALNHEYPMTSHVNDDPITGAVIETTIAVLNISAKLWEKVKEQAHKAPEDPKRWKLIKAFDGLIGHIYDMLIVAGCSAATAFRYAEEFGRFLNWGLKTGATDFTTENVLAFLKYRYLQSRSISKKRFGVLKPQAGIAVYYKAFFALKKIFDECLEMGLFEGLPTPPRPETIPPASKTTVKKLAEEAKTDHVLCTLLIINCLGLRPGVAALLTWDNFDENFRYVHFNTAYGKKSVYIEWPFRQALMHLKSKSGDDHALLLPALNGKSSNPISVRALEFRLARIALCCKIEEPLTLTALQKAWPVMPALLAACISETAGAQRTV